MPNQLPVPPELQHLIEKRESAERRKKSRRARAERRTCDLGPAGTIESISDIDLLPLEDRRSNRERRKTPRRKSPRRKR